MKIPTSSEKVPGNSNKCQTAINIDGELVKPVTCELSAISFANFSAGEMVLIAASALGRKVDANNLVTQLRKDVADGNVFGLIGLKFGVNSVELFNKLENLGVEQMSLLVRRLREWQSQDDAMAENGLPSVSCLKRTGIIHVSAPAAWGFFVLVLPTGHYEFVLRYPSRAKREETSARDQIMAELLRTAQASKSPDADDSLLTLVYRLMGSTGWRRARVVVDTHGVEVAEIPVRALVEDIDDGWLRGLVLAGVNAVDIYAN